MPGAVEVLATWEAGTTAGAAERTLLLHALARPRAGILDATPQIRTTRQVDNEELSLVRRCPGLIELTIKTRPLGCGASA